MNINLYQNVFVFTTITKRNYSNNILLNKEMQIPGTTYSSCLFLKLYMCMYTVYR